jgi:hypothetical protein
MSKPNVNKYLYKVFLICTKYTPITLSICFLVNLICNYCGTSCPILSYLGGVSVIFLGLLYLIAKVFQFCYLYRIPLHYITVGNALGLTNKLFEYPVSALIMCRIHFIVAGISLIIYIWFIYTHGHNPKVDYINKLCDTYCLI